MIALLNISVAEALTQKIINDSLIEEYRSQVDEMAIRRLKAWQNLIDNNAQLVELEKLQVVNNFFNQLMFQGDEFTWGEQDYWATPIEFLLKSAGDCEDFSIAKFFTLRAMGVSDEKLQLTYVKALEANAVSQAHMVVTYYSSPDQEPLILDNLIADILPASKRPDLRPVYSFNGHGLWKAKLRGLGKRLGDSKELTRWRDLNERMSAES